MTCQKQFLGLVGLSTGTAVFPFILLAIWTTCFDVWLKFSNAHMVLIFESSFHEWIKSKPLSNSNADFFSFIYFSYHDDGFPLV